MNNFQNQNWNSNQQNKQNQQSANSQNQPNTPPQPSWIMEIAGACLPVILKQFTGQDLAPSSAGSNNSEMQLVLSQVLSLQQQILTTQQAFNQRLMALESQAVQQFTSLNQQVQSIKSIRLSHSKETKAIDYNLQQEENN